jgi:DNA-directed RNA polymerase, sigma subunit (sigma70/sigma32)
MSQFLTSAVDRDTTAPMLPVELVNTSHFWAKVDRQGEDACWPWTATVGSDGYGHFRIGGRKGRVYTAHRVAYALDKGDPAQAHVLHACDFPLCCNPKHLTPGTHLQNMEEMVKRQRNRTPRVGNGFDKLGDLVRDEIRQRFAEGETNKSALAREYGVTATRVRQIINGPPLSA